MAVVLPSKQQDESTAEAPWECSTARAARNTAWVPDEHSQALGKLQHSRGCKGC